MSALYHGTLFFLVMLHFLARACWSSIDSSVLLIVITGKSFCCRRAGLLSSQIRASNVVTDLLSVDIFQLTHSNRSLRLYCMCSWNSKDDGGVVRINRFVTGDISDRQLITSSYNDIEDVAFLVSCQGNMLLVVCCGEKVVGLSK